MAPESACPYCHRTKPEPSTRDPFLSMLSREDEIEFLHDEMRRLELLISQSHAQQAALLRRMNEIQSATGVFPPEILSLILQEACAYDPQENKLLRVGEGEKEEYGGENGSGDALDLPVPNKAKWYDIPLALRLSSVSSQWREVALATPQLWSTIDFHPGGNAAIESNSSITSLALERSAGLPVRFGFGFESWGDEEPHVESSVLFHPSVDEKLNESLSRLVELKLVYPPKKWLEIGPQLSQVSKLAIANDRARTSVAGNSVLCLVNSSSLRSLTLKSIFNRVRLPSVSNITVLNLDVIHPEICIQLLFECPKLVVFRAETYEVQSTAPAFIPPPITFEDLRIFNWGGCHDTWNSYLVQSVRLPAVVKLLWDGMGDVLDPYEKFFSELPHTLRSLSLGTFESPQEHPIFNCFLDGKLQGVAKFTLDNCKARFIVDAMDQLGKITDGQFLFPELKKIKIEWLPRALDGPRHVFFEKLVEMCEERVKNGISFCLDITTEIPCPYWPEFVERRLSELHPELTVRVNGLYNLSDALGTTRQLRRIFTR